MKDVMVRLILFGDFILIPELLYYGYYSLSLVKGARQRSSHLYHWYPQGIVLVFRTHLMMPGDIFGFHSLKSIDGVTGIR